MKALPSLGFVGAIKLASSHILDFKGRSRRSEFWWWMLVVIVVGYAISLFAPNLLINAIISIIYMFFGLAATARRLHDSGKSAIWVYISYAFGCILQIFSATSPTITKLMDELNGGQVNPQAIEKIIEKGGGDMLVYGGLSALTGIIAIIVIIMCLFDSTPAQNKYGESPKYVNE